MLDSGETNHAEDRMSLWTILGLSVAIVALFCILLTEVFQNKRYYETYRWHLCGILTGLGVVLCVVAKCCAAKNAGKGDPQTTELESGTTLDDCSVRQHSLSALFNAQYWGIMCLLFGLTVTLINPLWSANQVARPGPPKPKPSNQVALAVLPTNVVEPQIPTPVEFPQLAIQGVIVRATNSCIIVNGRSFFTGDYVEEVKIVNIKADSVTLELHGRKKVILLDM